ncbi:hypothetical protein DY000_02062926 [Brassica cretica]|uniref:Uncharacterized protein n=1 Tax=Brassica cretica TaxID=69181 RepID=A0ABQ7AXW5_BRACR|nr:hypothetical protein DY000_02062926 [Brassica cretica]
MKALQSSSLRASPLNPLRTPSNRKSHQITNARLTRRRSFISASASVSAPKRDSGYPRTRSCCPVRVESAWLIGSMLPSSRPDSVGRSMGLARRVILMA